MAAGGAKVIKNKRNKVEELTAHRTKDARRAGVFGPAALLSGLMLAWVPAGAAQPVDAANTSTMPTNGLIRWWPNPFDGVEHFSFTEGVVMGLLPASGVEQEDSFRAAVGWVQLEPAVTNDTFSVACWVKSERGPGEAFVLALEDEELRWGCREDAHFHLIVPSAPRESEGTRVLPVPNKWQHLVFAREANGVAWAWHNGRLIGTNQMAVSRVRQPARLTVGNQQKGHKQWTGWMRDLRIYDRVLRSEEVKGLSDPGPPAATRADTRPRRRAAEAVIDYDWQTNVHRLPSRNFLHRHYTAEDGLPGNRVQALLQARSGHLWIGTDSGLARFDGAHFTTFDARNTPALAAAGVDISSLAEDVDGTIWVGIFGGLVRLRNGEFTAFTNMTRRFVLTAEPAGDGSVWVAGFRLESSRGPCHLGRFHPETATFSSEIIVPGNIRRLVVASNGLWMAVEDPELVLFWDGQASTPTVAGIISASLPDIRLGSEALPAGTKVRAWRDPVIDSDRWLEVALGGGGPTFHWFFSKSPRGPRVGKWTGPGNPEGWLGTPVGVMRRSGDAIERIAVGEQPSPSRVAAMCANREGGAWFGTWNDGLHLIQPRLVRLFTSLDGLSHDEIRSTWIDAKGHVLVGTSRGVNEISDGQLTQRSEGNVSAIVTDRHNTLWVAYVGVKWMTVERIDPAGKIRYLRETGLDWHNPNSLHVARDETLWTACGHGLTQLTMDAKGKVIESRRYPTAVELSGQQAVGLVEDGDGAIWSGSFGGGLFRVREGRVSRFMKTNGLPSDLCVPVRVDSRGALWCVSEAGLSRHANGRFQAIGESAGLPENSLADVIEDDDGFLWLPGRRGIHRIEREELEGYFAGRNDRVHSVTLGLSDGLLTPEMSAGNYPCGSKTPDGRIWIPTRQGLAIIEPRKVRLNTAPVPVGIESVRANRREVTLADAPLRLEPGSGRLLEFSYTAVSLVGAERIRFRYRLDGYDTDWSPDTSLRQAFYTNLKPGSYRFRVLASNSHGIWNPTETALAFEILPYLHETLWFRASAVGVVLASAALLIRRRGRRIRRMASLEEAQRLAAERARIARDMHDELGASITRLALSVDPGGAPASPSDASSILRREIAQTSRQLLRSLDEIVWTVNPGKDRLESLANYLASWTQDFCRQAGLRFELDLPDELPEIQISSQWRHQVFLIAKEALRNVVQHAAARCVQVALHIEGNQLSLTIADDGRGMNRRPSSASGDEPRLGGNGLSNMRARAAQLQGELTVTSNPEGGTSVTLRVPIPRLSQS
jgi:signal transduction histidine kinase/ligand-binding sensor domain-containing protein